jgi:hypothetical protein
MCLLSAYRVRASNSALDSLTVYLRVLAMLYLRKWQPPKNLKSPFL